MRSSPPAKSVCAAMVLLALSCLECGHGQDTISGQKAVDRIDAYVSGEAAHHAFRGVVLFGINGKIIFEKGYGMANEEWAVRHSPGTKFRIASLTKQFTGACILLLQERGRLNVHDAISRYLENLPLAWQPITIHQLLTHTSGIPNYTASPKMTQLFRTGATPEEMTALVAEKPLEFKPGSKFAYSNTGYILLGMIIEKVSGQPYADFLAGNIFGPLGMSGSGYDRASDIVSARASGYQTTKEGRLINADFIDMSVPFAAGGIYSTVEDLYRWNEALANGKLLSAESERQMFEEYPETSYMESHYGYGVVITRRLGRTLYYHGGGVHGFSSSIQRYPGEHLCIVVLCNLEPYKPWELSDHIAADLLGGEASTR